MPNQKTVERAALLLCLALLMAAVPLASASHAATAKKPPFKTGTYSGKTSQGQTITFEVKHEKCDLPVKPFTLHEAYCFVGKISDKHLAAFYPTLSEPCASPDLKPVTDPLFAASYQLSLSSTGHLAWDVKGLGQVITPNGSDSRLTLKVTGSKATGTVRQTEQVSDNGTTVLCDSGTVSFTASRA